MLSDFREYLRLGLSTSSSGSTTLSSTNSRRLPAVLAACALTFTTACTNIITGDADAVDEFGEFKATGGQCVGEVVPPDLESPFLDATSFGFLVYDGVLRQVISPAGDVRYGALNAGVELSEGARTSALQLASFDPTKLSTHEEKLAFWINAYNSLVLRAAAKAYDDNNTFRVDENNSAFFDQQVHVVGQKTYSLNEIEHGILRGTRLHSSTGTLPDDEWEALLALNTDLWQGTDFDPRFHFALNCASKSCPVLLPIAYTAETIDVTLDEVTQAFLDDEVRGANSEGISELFDFYFADFEQVGGAEAFISQYRDTSSLNLFRFLFYDWALNLAID